MYLGRIKTVLQKYRTSLTVPITVEGIELVGLMVKVGDSTLSSACRKELVPLIDWLLRAKDHSTTQKLQREAYNSDIRSPGDSIVVTLDFIQSLQSIHYFEKEQGAIKIAPVAISHCKVEKVWRSTQF